MARIAGVNIPTAKRIEVALTYIFGIGKKTAQDICANLESTAVAAFTNCPRKKSRKFVKLLTATTSLRVSCVAKLASTSRDLWISDVTEV